MNFNEVENHTCITWEGDLLILIWSLYQMGDLFLLQNFGDYFSPTLLVTRSKCFQLSLSWLFNRGCHMAIKDVRRSRPRTSEWSVSFFSLSVCLWIGEKGTLQFRRHQRLLKLKEKKKLENFQTEERRRKMYGNVTGGIIQKKKFFLTVHFCSLHCPSNRLCNVFLKEL